MQRTWSYTVASHRSLALAVVLAVAACGTEMGEIELDADSSLSAAARGGGPGRLGGGDKVYNCKRDKIVESPAQLRLAVAQSAMRIHVEANPGSDGSGSAEVFAYRLQPESGPAFTVTPTVYSGCSAGDDPHNFTFEPVQADTRYSVVALSRDRCGNVGESAAVEVVTPPALAETNPPSAQGPFNARVTLFIASMPGVRVYADDDTAVERVDFYANGMLVRSYSYSDVHGWSSLAGDSYFSALPSELYGTTALIEAEVFDVFGNSAVYARELAIPAS